MTGSLFGVDATRFALARHGKEKEDEKENLDDFVGRP